ncbi:ABC transporter substrate-binding protein [Corynebacterium breve]|uniref:ABC transporter substrate-binding protein n=1 Tax=Corynebacterium breve TaxID=3049799 RepID=A0ABY8VCZ3_9CORY|nr:ABC transporter substrate-binding protein [Corynebacterium breve]WIM67530.1 ABC transporter substrate-binding protein [Corynebacterium breve]
MNPLNIELSRRHALGLGAVAASSVALTACAGSGGGSSAKDDGSPLKFWSNHPGSSQDIEKEIIEAWNKDNEDAQVELITGGSNYEELGQKFNAALSGGELPDLIVASDVTWFNFALNEQTTNLDDLWEEAGVDPDTIVDTLREDYAYEGGHYGVPYCRSTCLMYWNTDILAESGLPTDRGPETWEEFAEWAPKIKEVIGDKPVVVIPDGSNYLDWYFQGMVWAFGGAYSQEWEPTFTEDATIKAGEFLQQQVKLGHFEISTDPTVAFGNGNSAALLQSTGSLGGLTETASVEFITTFLPGPGPSCPTGGAGVAIPSGIADDRKVKALKFIDFLTNTENTIKFSQATGYMPMRKDAVEHPDEVAYLEENPNAKTALDQLEQNTQPQDYARVFVPGGGQRVGAALDRIAIAQEDVKTVFEDLAKETQDVIDRDIQPLL